jgi:hypothetical protein
MPMANTLAYYDTATILTVKCFIVQAPKQLLPKRVIIVIRNPSESGLFCQCVVVVIYGSSSLCCYLYSRKVMLQIEAYGRK